MSGLKDKENIYPIRGPRQRAEADTYQVHCSMLGLTVPCTQSFQPTLRGDDL